MMSSQNPLFLLRDLQTIFISKIHATDVLFCTTYMWEIPEPCVSKLGDKHCTHSHNSPQTRRLQWSEVLILVWLKVVLCVVTLSVTGIPSRRMQHNKLGDIASETCLLNAPLVSDFGIRCCGHRVCFHTRLNRGYRVLIDVQISYEHGN